MIKIFDLSLIKNNSHLKKHTSIKLLSKHFYWCVLQRLLIVVIIVFVERANLQ